MPWYSWLIAIAVGLGLGFIMRNYRNRDYSNIYKLTKDQFMNNMRKGQLVDVRKKEDFENDKIKGAKNFNKGQMVGKYSKLRKDQSVYLYDKNGRKAVRLAKALSNDGFTTIYVLDGGLQKY